MRKRISIGALLLLAALSLYGCDNWFSPTNINNQGQSSGQPEPSPSPSCVTGSVILTPTSGTTDPLVAPGTVVAFDLAVLDPNGSPVPAVCRGPVTASAAGDCELQASEPPTVLFEGPDPCTVSASHGGRSGSYTLQANP
jgi:hypothetical protein